MSNGIKFSKVNFAFVFSNLNALYSAYDKKHAFEMLFSSTQAKMQFYQVALTLNRHFLRKFASNHNSLTIF